MRVVVDGGNGMAGPMVGPILRRLGLDPVELYFEPDGEFPDHEPNPLLEENRRLIIGDASSPRVPTSGSPGTATPTAASSSTTTAPSATATSSARCSRGRRSRKSRGATILYDPRSSRAVPDTVDCRRRPGRAFSRRPRVLQGADARGGRRLRRRGLRPLLLPRVLVRGLGDDPGAADARAALQRGQTARRADVRSFAPATSSPARSTREVADPAAKIEEIATRYADAEISRLDGVSVDYPDWHFNVRPSNTEPLLRLNLESLVSGEHMERRRDEVLGLIRG